MTPNQKQKWEDMTLKSLEAELRRLRELEAPETLEDKLLAAIPYRGSKVAREHQVKWRPVAWDFGATAAATVLILGLMSMVNFSLSTPSQTLLTELNDTSLCYTGWEQNNFLYNLYDQNNTLIEDTNYTNFNGQR